MPTYIKTGFWEKARKGYKEWLNLDQLITNIVTPLIPPAPSYKVYTALLQQDLTGAPVATVLENTLGGTVVWSRLDPGEYQATVSGLFTLNKTMIQISSNSGQGNTVTFGVTDTNTIEIGTADDSFTLADNLLSNTPIEIRVYN